jgi:hypothetical protein
VQPVQVSREAGEGPASAVAVAPAGQRVVPAGRAKPAEPARRVRLTEAAREVIDVDVLPRQPGLPAIFDGDPGEAVHLESAGQHALVSEAAPEDQLLIDPQREVPAYVAAHRQHTGEPEREAGVGQQLQVQGETKRQGVEQGELIPGARFEPASRQVGAQVPAIDSGPGPGQAYPRHESPRSQPGARP